MRRISLIYDYVLLAPAVLPLLYFEGMMYPLMAPKTLVLRALGLIAVALFSFLALNGRAFYWQRLKYWGAWIPGALVALAYVASMLGVDFYRSFWSTFERGDGLLTLTVCAGYFYLILLSVERTWLLRLFSLVAWVGSLVGAYLVLQWFSITVVDLPFIVQNSGRVGGTMGNAAFAAAYLGMAFFATLAAISQYGGWRRRLLSLGAVVEIIAIVLTATRGTLLALALIAFVALAYETWKGQGRARRYAGATLLVLVLSAGLLVAFRGALRDVPFEPVRRLASVSLSDRTIASRLFLWQNLSREALTQPFLGYGAEHIDIPFDRIYDPTLIAEEWFDRSHDTYLDYALQYGIGGALLYLALVLALAVSGWRLRREGDRIGTLLLGFVAVYALQNVFVFDTGVTLWLLLAVSAGALAYRASYGAQAFSVSRPQLGVAVALAFLVLLLPVFVNPWRANLLAYEAYLYQVADVPRANAATEKGLALGTYADLEFGYNAYFMYTEEQIRRLSDTELSLAYKNARNVLERNFRRYPYDVRTAVYLSQVLSSGQSEATEDSALLSEVLALAIQESPKRAQPWYILANLSIAEGNTHSAGSEARRAGYAAAKDILERYIELVPGLAEPHFVLAELEYAMGEREAAAQEAAAGKAVYKGGLGAARRAATYYESVLDLQNAAFFLREILRDDPTDENARADLSQIEAYEQSIR